MGLSKLNKMKRLKNHFQIFNFKKLNKKGVFFTFIALFMIILIVAIASTKQRYRYTEKSNAIATRVRTMNGFIEDYEKDVNRELYIGGYRSLLSMNTYMRQTQDYIEDFDLVFTEILINGTANSTSMELMHQEGQAASLSGWLLRINEEASQLNVRVDVVVNDIYLEHITPWVIRLNVNMTSHITDSKELAHWNITKVYFKEFSILGLEDPLYTVGTEDKITVLINMTPSLDFVNQATNNTDVLNTHIENNYYVNSTKAPSFLMRFSGNLTNSTYGIESMVYPVDMSAQMGSYKQRSLVDYIYFGNQTTTDYCNFQNMSSWFRLDSEHLEFYGVDDFSKTSCS